MAENDNSLQKELEQESQLTEIRTCFGLAIYNAQLMEKQIINMFVAAQLHNKHNITRNELHEMFDIHFRENIGKLLQDLKTAFQYTDVFGHQLEDALKIRNLLSRGFFHTRDKMLTYPTGREKVIEELEMASVVFGKINACLKDIYHAYLVQQKMTPVMVEEVLRNLK